MTFLKFIRQICLTVLAFYCIQVSFVQGANAQGLQHDVWLDNPMIIKATGVDDGKVYHIYPTRILIMYVPTNTNETKFVMRPRSYFYYNINYL